MIFQDRIYAAFCRIKTLNVTDGHLLAKVRGLVEEWGEFYLVELMTMKDSKEFHKLEPLGLLCQIIRKLVIPAGKRVSSAMDGKLKSIHGAWIPAIPAGMTILDSVIM
jgi:hypothetical protein